MQSKMIIISFLFLLTTAVNSLSAQVVKITDPNFKKKLIERGVDKNGDGEIQVAEAQKVTRLYVDEASITSLEGIKAFSNLEEFGFYYNKIRNIDFQGMTKLKMVYGFANQIETVNMKGCTNIEDLYLMGNRITQLDITAMKNLKSLKCQDNRLTTLDVRNHPQLNDLSAENNQIADFKFDTCPNLVLLMMAGNRISGPLDLRGSPKLKSVFLSKNPLTSLDVRGLGELEQLFCLNCSLTTLNLSGTAKLQTLMW